MTFSKEQRPTIVASWLHWLRLQTMKMAIWSASCSSRTNTNTTTICSSADVESEKLDDEWLESVEEQGLLLLVWRHHITKQYIKDVL